MWFWGFPKPLGHFFLKISGALECTKLFNVYVLHSSMQKKHTQWASLRKLDYVQYTCMQMIWRIGYQIIVSIVSQQTPTTYITM